MQYNGSNRLVWYIMTTAVGLVILGGGAWVRSVSGEQYHLRAAQKEIQAKQATICERLTAVETKLGAVSDTTKETRIDVREIRRLLEQRR